MADLALGDAVTLSPKHFAGDVIFKLTTTQLKKIEKAKAAGRGCQLKLTPAQVKHMAQKGSGRFTDYLRSGVNYVKPIVRKGVAAGVDMGADYISDKVHQGARYVKKKIGVDQQGKGWLGKLGKKMAHGGVDFVGDMLGVGGALPNPYANTNEALRAAMFQKKVPVAVGSGLKW